MFPLRCRRLALYCSPSMPRIPRGQVAGHVCHVLNRGNGGVVVFHKESDSTAFLDLRATAKAKHPVNVFGLCLMPNHFHLVAQPATEAALSRFMQWCMTSPAATIGTTGVMGTCGRGASKFFPFNRTAIS